MGENGGFVVRLHHGDKFVGNVAISPQNNYLPFKPMEELRISSFSATSDRCSPLLVLHTIASGGLLFKLEEADLSDPSADYKELEIVHSVCLREFKTAMIFLPGGVELHLVAMNSNRKQRPCFWGYSLVSGLYRSCLTMLNLRCLALVFDLDETLIVANTMRSFEDRIDALGLKLKTESDVQKQSGMSAELKRYMQDRALLKQYIDEDRVWDASAEKFINTQIELVPSPIEGGPILKRPVVRLQDRSMIFTRINPNIRDTSVLVRFRPAWEELRSYLTAKGRKRFEVFVCTMSEREYALEMWRLLDPEAELISTKEMLNRIVCVKSGSKKSLTNMFSSGNCHPKMAMVIDDRLKVWEDQDQPQVHVVPAFAPYYAPQAETSTPVPILCVARNVACNVRGCYFRDLDEGLSKRVSEVDYDADASKIPPPPIVDNYMIVEEEVGAMVEVVNDNNGTADVEPSKRMQEGVGIGTSAVIPSPPVESEGWKPIHFPAMQMTSPFPPPILRPQTSFGEVQLMEKQEPPRFQNELLTMRPLTPPVSSHIFEPSIQSSPVREEGEVPESELDPDTRRRLLILQHGQDTQHAHVSQDQPVEPAFPVKPILRVTVPAPAPAGGWLGAEEEMSPRQLGRTSSGIILEPESPCFGKQPTPQFFPGGDFMSNDAYSHDEKQRTDSIGYSGHVFPENDGSCVPNNLNQRELHIRSNTPTSSSNPVAVLQEIAQKCNTKLEFRSLLNTTTMELLFSVEVLFGGDKVGEGTGRTKKEAQHIAADNSLRFMASQFIAHPTQAINALGHGRLMGSYSNDDSTPRWNTRDPRFFAGLGPSVVDEDIAPVAGISGQSKLVDFWHHQDPNRSPNPVTALKDYCTAEGINVVFKDPSSTPSELQSQGYICQVEVAGRIMGKGNGRSWEEAKQKAADEALKSLRSTTQQGRGASKRMNSPRSPPLQSNKRMRSGELSRGLQRMPLPSPRRY